MHTKQIKFICCVFVFCTSFSSIYCQESKFSFGLFSGNNCNISCNNSVWNIQANPAKLAYFEHTALGVAYSSAFNGTNTLCTRINVCTQLKQNSIGSSIILFGNSHFRETYYNLCLSKKLNSHNAIGIKFDFLKQYQEEYSSNYALFPELAYYGQTEKISYLIHLVNPISFSQQNIQLQSAIKFGGEYHITPLLSVGSRISFSNEITVSMATTYKIKDIVFCTLTYQTSKNPFTIEIQIPLEHFICNYETICNFYLGFSHTISFIYTL